MVQTRDFGSRYNESGNECRSRKYPSISLRMENFEDLTVFFLSLNTAELTGERKWDYFKELCTIGRYFISRVISDEYAENLSLSCIAFEENCEGFESFIPLIGRLLNMNDENKVEDLKIFNLSFIDSINKNKSKNNSNPNETLASTSSSVKHNLGSKKLTVIYFKEKTAQPFEG